MHDVSHPHSPTKGFRMTLRHLPGSVLALTALTALLALTAGLACTDTTAPDDATERAATDLRLLAAPYGTPQLVTTETSFYAVKGRNTGVDIWYRPLAGQSDSSKFLEFRVGSASLDRRPDGSVVAPGDSVLITVTVLDPRHFILDLQPSGLKFSANDLPKLRISFAACGDDLNYDGRVDGTDASMQASLSLWRQESPFQPWFRVASTVTANVKEVNAQLGGFTGYALMW
jgi:hypothetical protein